MKKYRLIKELPFENSPKIGYISKPKNGELHYYNHNWFNPKNYPEFWEEVIEKNPLKLEVGKIYTIKYKHYMSKPRKIKITNFTADGYPMGEDIEDSKLTGVICGEYYEIIKEISEMEYDTILMNEPCLSINDVYTIINSWSSFNKLKKLVQSRL